MSAVDAEREEEYTQPGSGEKAVSLESLAQRAGSCKRFAQFGIGNKDLQVISLGSGKSCPSPSLKWRVT